MSDTDNYTQEQPFMDDMDCNEWWTTHSVGIEVTEYPVTITYKNTSKPEAEKNWHTPTVALFYSDDGMVWPGIAEEAPNHYWEYSIIRSDAYGWKTHASAFQYESIHTRKWRSWVGWLDVNREGTICTVTAVRYGRYALIRMENAGTIVIATTTLPSDAEDKLYFSLTGELCTMTDFSAIRESEPIGPGYIEPVIEKKDFIPDKEGDIPNVDCSGWWLQHSDGILIYDKPVHVTYCTVSYPQAKESWHAPFAVLYSSLDQLVNGVAYTEFSITRNDGHGWMTDASGFAFKDFRSEEFVDWPTWIDINKAGTECTLTAYRKDDMIVLESNNAGLKAVSHTIIPITNALPVYLSLSGELCAITNIRITRD